VRQHRALELTEAGLRLLGVITPVLAQLREIVRSIRAPATREALSSITTPRLANHTRLQTAPARAGSMPLDWDLWLMSIGAAPVQPAARLTFTQSSEAMTAAQAGQGVRPVLGLSDHTDSREMARLGI